MRRSKHIGLGQIGDGDEARVLTVTFTIYMLSIEQRAEGSIPFMYLNRV